MCLSYSHLQYVYPTISNQTSSNCPTAIGSTQITPFPPNLWPNPHPPPQTHPRFPEPSDLAAILELRAQLHCLLRAMLEVPGAPTLRASAARLSRLLGDALEAQAAAVAHPLPNWKPEGEKNTDHAAHEEGSETGAAAGKAEDDDAAVPDSSAVSTLQQEDGEQPAERQALQAEANALEAGGVPDEGNDVDELRQRLQHSVATLLEVMEEEAAGDGAGVEQAEEGKGGSSGDDKDT